MPSYSAITLQRIPSLTGLNFIWNFPTVTLLDLVVLALKLLAPIGAATVAARFMYRTTTKRENHNVSPTAISSS